MPHSFDAIRTMPPSAARDAIRAGHWARHTAGLAAGYLQANVVIVGENDALDFLRRASVRQTIFFLWRPSLRDPKDDHVAELAIAAGCDAIVTYNHRDFSPIVRFDIAVLSPHELLTRLGEQ